MKIRSNFYDYYDEQAFIYGVDPNLFYDRTVKEQVFDLPPHSDVFFVYNVPHIDNFKISYLSILGYGFAIGTWIIPPTWNKDKILVKKGSSEIKVLHRNCEKFYDRFLRSVNENTRMPFFYKKDFEEQFKGVYSKDLMKIHKELNAPIFSYDPYTNKKKVKVLDGVPCLARLGFEEVLDAFLLYNNLQDFFSKQLEEKYQELEMTEKEKVESKGFDPVVSFRHRHKPKQLKLF